VLLDADGPLVGTKNICQELVRRSQTRSMVVLRGDVADRVVANAEEMTLHVMSAEVSLILAQMAGDDRLAPPEVRRSLENGLGYLNDSVDRVLEALPADRTLSFLEVTLFCVVTHLPFRQVLDVASYARLKAFCDLFGERESAQRTEYRFDASS